MPIKAETPGQNSQTKYIIYDLDNSDCKPMAFLETVFLVCLDTQQDIHLQFIFCCLPFLVLLKFKQTKKKLERKTVFSLLTSHVIKMLARIVLGCDFYIQYYSFEWNYIIEGNPWHALLFYFASPTGNSAHHCKVPVKAPWKPAPR